MTLRRRLATGALLALIIVAVGSLISILWPEPEPAQPVVLEPRERNEPFEVPHESPGAHPVVVAWECSRADRPTFVLYDDGRWLRDPILQGRCGDDLITGVLSSERAAALRRAMLDAGLLSMPPRASVNPSMVDGNTVTIAVAERDRWIAASVESMVARRSRADHEAAAGGAPPQPPPDASGWVWTMELQYELPVPEPFLVANELLVSFDASGGAPFESSEQVVQIVDAGEPDPEGEAFLAAPRRWPSALPRWDEIDEARPGGRAIIARVPADRLREAQRELERGDRFLVGGHVIEVSPPYPGVPAEDELRALEDAFLRFARVLPPLDEP